MLDTNKYEIHESIVRETQAVLDIAKSAIQKIIHGGNITIDERDSILEIGLSCHDFIHLQAMHGSKVVDTFETPTLF